MASPGPPGRPGSAVKKFLRRFSGARHSTRDRPASSQLPAFPDGTSDPCHDVAASGPSTSSGSLTSSVTTRLRQLDATLMAHCAQTDAVVRAWAGGRAAQPDDVRAGPIATRGDDGGGGGGSGGEAIPDPAAHEARRRSSSKRLSAADREAIVSLTHSEALLRQVSPDAEFELVSSADDILAEFSEIEEALPVLSNEGAMARTNPPPHAIFPHFFPHFPHVMCSI